MKVKGKRKALFIVLSVIFGLYAVSLLFPFAYMLLNSFKTNGEFLDNVWALPKRLIEQNDLFRNYKTAFAESGLVNMLINSVVLTFFGTLVATLFPVAVAYILSKYRFKLNSVIFTVAIIFMVIPNVGTAVVTDSQPIDLVATMESNTYLERYLGVEFTVLEGNAEIVGKQLRITGAGKVVIQAKAVSQPSVTATYEFTVADADAQYGSSEGGGCQKNSSYTTLAAFLPLLAAGLVVGIKKH